MRTFEMNLPNEKEIKEHEGYRSKAYLPTPHDVPTIGWGHTKGVKMGQVVTVETAQKYFDADVAEALAGVEALVRVPLNINQKGALVSFVFNLGIGNFKSSTLLKKLNAGDYTGAADQLLRWNKQKQNGELVELEGLTKRRASERELFLKTPLKPIVTSKEIMTGVAAVVTGASGVTLPEVTDQTVMYLSVALVAIGIIVLAIRLYARSKGDR
jgi:lysozyme